MPKGLGESRTCVDNRFCVNGCSILAACGCSSEAESLLAMQGTGVRFPVSALDTQLRVCYDGREDVAIDGLVEQWIVRLTLNQEIGVQFSAGSPTLQK